MHENFELEKYSVSHEYPNNTVRERILKLFLRPLHGGQRNGSISETGEGYYHHQIQGEDPDYKFHV